MPSLLENLLTRVAKRVTRWQPDRAPKTDTDILSYSPDEPSYTNTWDWYENEVQLSMERRLLYRDYDTMDLESPEIAAALDIYADNISQGDHMSGGVLTVVTPHQRAKKILTQVIKNLELDSQLWSIARTVAKYGDDFEELVVDDQFRFYRLKHLPPGTMIRKEDRYGRLEEDAFVQIDPDTGKEIARFKKWQVVHFRLLRDRDRKYGTSILYSARRIFRQLQMMEDAMVIARLTRAHQRYGFLIDTEGLTPDEKLKYLEKVKRSLKKRRTIDPKTGKMDLSYNPLSSEEDIFIAVNEKGRADIKVLQGETNLGKIDDVVFFRNKLYAALKVPKAYLGLEEGVNAKSTLREQDVQFARSVRRLQLAIITGLRQIFDFALILNGINPETAQYKIVLPAVSGIDELRHWQIQQLKLQIAQMYKETIRVSEEWIMEVLLGMSREEIDRIVNDPNRPPEIIWSPAGGAPVVRGQAKGSKPSANTGGVNTEPPGPEEVRKIKAMFKEELATLKDLIEMELDGLEAQKEVSQ